MCPQISNLARQSLWIYVLSNDTFFAFHFMVPLILKCLHFLGVKSKEFLKSLPMKTKHVSICYTDQAHLKWLFLCKKTWDVLKSWKDISCFCCIYWSVNYFEFGEKSVKVSLRMPTITEIGNIVCESCKPLCETSQSSVLSFLLLKSVEDEKNVHICLAQAAFNLVQNFILIYKFS